jgi:hypothetical protein
MEEAIFTNYLMMGKLLIIKVIIYDAKVLIVAPGL